MTISREAIRLWCIKFGAIYARHLKTRHRGYRDTFYIDKAFVKINGKQHYRNLRVGAFEECSRPDDHCQAERRIVYIYSTHPLDQKAPLKWYLSMIAALALAIWTAVAPADSTDAACEIYTRGENHTDILIPCGFSQRQGYITIIRSDGVTHDLSPVGDAPGNFEDQLGRSVFRQSGLGETRGRFSVSRTKACVFTGTLTC